MIRIDFQNVLDSKIGARNGLSKSFLNDFLKKSEPLLKKVLKSEDKPGYAFLALPEDTKTVQAIHKFAKSQKGKWQNIVVLGIGGSALGGIALQDSILGNWHNLKNKPRLFFVDNIDPDYVESLFSMIDFKKTLFVVVSKSGGTVEPMALYAVAKEKLLKTVKKTFRQHLVFVTDPKSGILREMGNKEKIQMFDIPPNVGGRFSVHSAAALVPAALAGINIEKLMRGAKKMKEEIKKSHGEKNPALLLAALQFLMDWKKGKNMVVMMPYSNRLYRIADWYRQLLAESIGKNSKAGPTPMAALGTTDQHSQLQLWQEGPEDKWIIFLRVLNQASRLKLGSHLPSEMAYLKNRAMADALNAALKGTAESLAKSGKPNCTIELNQINEETVGALLFLLEVQVALLGELYGVNAFNQPGVEQSKIMTKKILSR